MRKNYCDCCGKELRGTGRELSVVYESAVTTSLNRWDKELCGSCYRHIKKEVWKSLNIKKVDNNASV